MSPCTRISSLPTALAAAWLFSGCFVTGGNKSDAAAAAPAPTAAAAPAPPGPKIGPGMKAAGEVVDPKKVESAFGQKIKGLEDWEGEITGKPAPGSKFSQLKIGMPMRW